MKRNKKWLYAAMLLIFTVFVVGVIEYKRIKNDEIPTLKERTGSLAANLEWKKTKDNVAALMIKISQNPNDAGSLIKLVQVYIQEGRVTGDRQYYDMAALKL